MQSSLFGQRGIRERSDDFLFPEARYFRVRSNFPAKESSSSPFRVNHTFMDRFHLETYPLRSRRKEIRKPFGPLHDGDTIAKEILVQSQVDGCRLIFQSIKIEMIYRNTT